MAMSEGLDHPYTFISELHHLSDERTGEYGKSYTTIKLSLLDMNEVRQAWESVSHSVRRSVTCMR